MCKRTNALILDPTTLSAIFLRDCWSAKKRIKFYLQAMTLSPKPFSKLSHFSSATTLRFQRRSTCFARGKLFDVYSRFLFPSSFTCRLVQILTKAPLLKDVSIRVRPISVTGLFLRFVLNRCTSDWRLHCTHLLSKN